jgi:hypothetical protein
MEVRKPILTRCVHLLAPPAQTCAGSNSNHNAESINRLDHNLRNNKSSNLEHGE